MSDFTTCNKSIRAHSIHVAIARDYQRIQMAKKQDIKLEKDFLNLERRINSHAKWNERALLRSLRHTSTTNIHEHPSMTLEEFMARERLKRDNINNAKNIANQNIRPN